LTTRIDLTLRVEKASWITTFIHEKMSSFGHLGTHFDVMDKEFSLENIIRSGIVFDVSRVRDRDISIQDVQAEKIGADDFVMFHTGFLSETGYGTPEYFKNHPQLAPELIYFLLEKRISLIGVDCAGVRRGGEHTPMDQYCAERSVFIVENLANTPRLVELAQGSRFTVYTFPIHIAGMSGLPCRVIAEL